MMPPIFQNIGRVIQYVRQIKSDPAFASQLLLQQGSITQEQYNEIQQLGIGSNPEAIGQYLMNRGAMDPRVASQMKDSVATPIQNSMIQN